MMRECAAIVSSRLLGLMLFTTDPSLSDIASFSTSGTWKLLTGISCGSELSACQYSIRNLIACLHSGLIPYAEDCLVTRLLIGLGYVRSPTMLRAFGKRSTNRCWRRLPIVRMAEENFLWIVCCMSPSSTGLCTSKRWPTCCTSCRLIGRCDLGVSRPQSPAVPRETLQATSL